MGKTEADRFCLKAEIDKSKQVENELKTIKETAMDLDKLFSDDKIRKSVSNISALLDNNNKIEKMQLDKSLFCRMNFK